MADIGFAYTGTPPLDLAAAPARARRAYWREAARKGVELRRVSLSRGLGADGKPVKPISSRTRRNRARNVDPRTGRTPYSPMGRARPDAPPLQSTGAKSRTRAWLYGKGETDRAWFGWRNGWGDILAMHRTGFYVTFASGRTAWVPPRDVIGLPPADRKALDAHMARWWAANRDRLAPSQRVYGTGQDYFTSATTGATRIDDAGRYFVFRGPADLRFGNLPPLKPPPGSPSPTTPRPRTPTLQTSVRRRPIPARPVPLVGVPYDGYLPQEILDALPDELKGVETFGQLARLRVGRLWWAAVGLTIFLEILRRLAA